MRKLLTATVLASLTAASPVHAESDATRNLATAAQTDQATISPFSEPESLLDRLSVSDYGSRRFEGTFHSQIDEQDLELEFRSVRKPIEQYDYTVRIGVKRIDAIVDMRAETIQVDGHKTVLEHAEKVLMHQAAAAIGKYYHENYHEITAEQLMLIQLMGYWSRAPEGHAIGKRTISP